MFILHKHKCFSLQKHLQVYIAKTQRKFLVIKENLVDLKHVCVCVYIYINEPGYRSQ